MKQQFKDKNRHNLLYMVLLKPSLLLIHQFKVMKGNILFPALMKLIILVKF